MASYAGLLELRGPHGHTVRDFPCGVLEAAAATVPPPAMRVFVLTLLQNCSFWEWYSPFTLTHVLKSADHRFFKCPGISKEHLVAFRRRLWPRQQTFAELERYSSIVAQVCSLKRMDPKLRQLVEAVFSQESESVRVAVLQHLLDVCCDVLSAAPLRLELVLTDELPSMTIPDDPRLHQLLRQLHAEVHAELRRQGKAVEVRKLPPGLVPRVLGGSSTRPHEGCPGTPAGQDSGGKKPSLAAGFAAVCESATSGLSGAASSNVASSGPGGKGSGMPVNAQAGLRHRRHGSLEQHSSAA